MGSRNWIVTWNNPEPEFITDCELISEYIRGGDENNLVSYAIWQLEKAGTTGTVHFQMYFELRKPQRFSFIKKLLKTDKLHCEAKKGTRDEARDYCRKEDTRLAGPFEYGEWKDAGQGRRSDLESVVNSAKEGKDLLQTYEELGVAAIRFNKQFNVARLMFAANVPRIKPVVIVHWGESGTGKTHDATSGLEHRDYFIKSPGKWWDGYEGQSVVIMDDIPIHSNRAEAEATHAYFLRLLDQYKMNVEVKGGSIPFNPRKIILTSNHHPGSWFPDVPNKKPLFRRINECYHYSGDYFAGTSTRIAQELHSDIIL